MTGLDVRPLARLISEPLVLVDVGVRWGFPPRWETLVPAARLLGFDPDAAECSRLRERYRDQPEVRIEALALGESAGDAQLHIARDPGSSSLLQAAKSSRESVQSVGSVRVPVERLDDWAARHELQRADVLKLDAQGAELAVLRGSPRLLRTAFAVQLEVEFSMLYVGQPLFGDVDAHMRDAGFALWRLDDLHHEPATTVAAAPLVRERRTYGDRTVETPGPGGRLVWGEATYVRVDSTPQAALAAWAVGLDDLATGIVAELARLGPAQVAAEALEVLRRGSRRRHARFTAWRARNRGVVAAARRFVAVRRLARQGRDASEIAARTGLTVQNVEQHLAVRPRLRRGRAG